MLAISIIILQKNTGCPQKKVSMFDGLMEPNKWFSNYNNFISLDRRKPNWKKSFFVYRKIKLKIQ